MKDNGDEENDKLVPSRYTQSHSNEDTVEQNTKLEKDTLKKLLALLLLRSQNHMHALEACLLKTLLSSRLSGILLAAGLVSTGNLLHLPAVQASQAVTDARGPAAEGAHVADWKHTNTPHAAAVVARFVVGGGIARGRVLLVGRKVSGRMKDHLDDGDEENSRQGNGTRNRRIVASPKVAQTRVAQGNKGCGKQVDEGRGDEDASTEVTDGKKETVWNSQTREFDSQDGKGASKCRYTQNDEQSRDMEPGVVIILAYAPSIAGGPLKQGRGLD